MTEYLELIDEHCRTCLATFFIEFKDHSEPVISIPDMQIFIDQAPEVFGDTWGLLYNLRGIKPSRKKEEQMNIGKAHSLFYDTLAMARRKNRKVLKH